MAEHNPKRSKAKFEADRVVIVEFETAKRAREFYHSATYQAARQKRLHAAEFKMLLLEGTPGVT